MCHFQPVHNTIILTFFSKLQHQNIFPSLSSNTLIFLCHFPIPPDLVAHLFITSRFTSFFPHFYITTLYNLIFLSSHSLPLFPSLIHNHTIPQFSVTSLIKPLVPRCWRASRKARIPWRPSWSPLLSCLSSSLMLSWESGRWGGVWEVCWMVWVSVVGCGWRRVTSQPTSLEEEGDGEREWRYLLFILFFIFIEIVLLSIFLCLFFTSIFLHIFLI